MIGYPISQRIGSHLPILNGKYFIPLSTYEPNKLARDETPHLVIHIIIYMSIIETQRERPTRL